MLLHKFLVGYNKASLIVAQRILFLVSHREETHSCLDILGRAAPSSSGIWQNPVPYGYQHEVSVSGSLSQFPKLPVFPLMLSLHFPHQKQDINNFFLALTPPFASSICR